MCTTIPRLPRFLNPSLPVILGVLAFCGSSLAITPAFASSVDGVVSTVAGTGTAGVAGDGGAAASAQLYYPQAAAVDSAGNVYIADTSNDRIRKVSAATGLISTYAGTGVGGYLGDGGPATAARLNNPSGLAVDAAGNLYIADQYNVRIRMVAAATGIITTVAGSGTAGFGGDNGVATAAQLNYPYGVTLDSAGNLYIADTNNARIRRVASGTGIITTVAGDGTSGYNGDGTATAVHITTPRGVAVDTAGTVFFTDGNRIRKVTAGVISTIVGDSSGGFAGEGGPAASARVSIPYGVAVDAVGNLYIADTYNHRIRKVTVATGLIATVAGTGTATFTGDGGLGTAASLYYPIGLAVDAAGAMYIADEYNHRVRRVAPPIAKTLLMSTIAGDGTAGYNGDGSATGVHLSTPRGTAVDLAGNVYITDGNRIRKISGGVISTVAGDGSSGYTGEGGPATSARLSLPYGVAVDYSAGNVYIADTYNHRVRKITVSTGVITTIAGNGVAGFLGDGGAATAGELYYPIGVAVDLAGNVYIADDYNHRIRKVTVATGVITTIAGTGVAGVAGDAGPAASAQLNYPQGVAVDGVGNVYIADTSNDRIRKISAATGLISTFAGTGVSGYAGDSVPATSAQLAAPTGVAVDIAGNVYVADQYAQRIRKITAATGLIATVAGSANVGYGGDGGVASAAQMNYPYGVAVDIVGSVYVADTNGQRIRKAAVQVAAPTSLTVVRSGSSAAAYWTGSVGATSYYLYRGTSSGGEVFIANVVGTSYVDTTVAPNTTYYYLVTAISYGTQSPASNEVVFRLGHGNTSGDFYGDGKADLTVFRPSNGTWYALRSGTGFTTYTGIAWGTSADITVPGDYDGDGKTDIAIYRPSNGTWYILQSSTNFTGYFTRVWGGATDIPVPGDYDGDGKADIAIYRPSNGSWYILLSSTNWSGYVTRVWGASTDIPVAADYDGDGKIDAAVFRPSTGGWYILLSSTNSTAYVSYIWGIATDVPVMADYDGDGKADVAVFRPSTGVWYILKSSTNNTGYAAYQWGISTDVPVPADYDGDGKADVAIFRPSSGAWYILQSGANFTTYATYQWGAGTDIAVLKRP